MEYDRRLPTRLRILISSYSVYLWPLLSYQWIIIFHPAAPRRHSQITNRRLQTRGHFWPLSPLDPLIRALTESSNSSGKGRHAAPRRHAEVIKTSQCRKRPMSQNAFPHFIHSIPPTGVPAWVMKGKGGSDSVWTFNGAALARLLLLAIISAKAGNAGLKGPPSSIQRWAEWPYTPGSSRWRVHSSGKYKMSKWTKNTNAGPKWPHLG